MALNIVLFEPEIPANTGNIGRTCVATGTRLHLIEPLGFRLNEKSIKRAGMDYWEHLDVTRYINFEDFLEKKAFADAETVTENPEQKDVEGFNVFLERYVKGLECEKAAVDSIE